MIKEIQKRSPNHTGFTPIKPIGVASSSVGPATARPGDYTVDLEAEDNYDDVLQPNPEVVEEQEVLLRSYSGKGAVVSSCQREKRSR